MLILLVGVPYFYTWTTLAMMLAIKEHTSKPSFKEVFGRTRKLVLSTIKIIILSILIYSGMIVLGVLLPGVVAASIVLLMESYGYIPAYTLPIIGVVSGIILGILLVVISINNIASFIFAQWELIENDVHGMNAIAASKERGKPVFYPLAWRLFYLAAIYFVISIVIDLLSKLLPISSLIYTFILTPLSIAVVFVLFSSVKEINSAKITEFQKGARKSLVLYSIVGVFGCIALFIVPVVVIGYLGAAKQKGTDALRESSINIIQLNLELYHDSNNKYPDTLTDLTQTGPNNPTPMQASDMEDPATKQPYSYTVSDGNQSYTLCATLSTGKQDCVHGTGDNSGTAFSTSSSGMTQSADSATAQSQTNTVTTYNNSTYGYSVSVPSCWTKSGTGDPDITFTSPDKMASERIWVTPPSNNTDPTSELNSYIQSKKAIMAKDLGSFKVESETTYTLGNQPAKAIQFSWIDSYGDGVSSVLIVGVRNGRIYELTETMPANAPSALDYIHAFAQINDSFQY